MFCPLNLLEQHFVLLHSIRSVIIATKLSDLSVIYMFFLLYYDLSYEYIAIIPTNSLHRDKKDI